MSILDSFGGTGNVLIQESVSTVEWGKAFATKWAKPLLIIVALGVGAKIFGLKIKI